MAALLSFKDFYATVFHCHRKIMLVDFQFHALGFEPAVFTEVV